LRAPAALMNYLNQCVLRCGDSTFAVDSWRSPGCGACAGGAGCRCAALFAGGLWRPRR
jgi:hypothetical protein